MPVIHSASSEANVELHALERSCESQGSIAYFADSVCDQVCRGCGGSGGPVNVDGRAFATAVVRQRFAELGVPLVIDGEPSSEDDGTFVVNEFGDCSGPRSIDCWRVDRGREGQGRHSVGDALQGTAKERVIPLLRLLFEREQPLLTSLLGDLDQAVDDDLRLLGLADERARPALHHRRLL